LITAFETDSDALLTQVGGVDLSFTAYLAEAKTAFEYNPANTTEADFSCLDTVRANFTNVYDDPVDGTTPAAGLKVDLKALYDDCKAELDEFKIDAETEMDAQITAYENDSMKQEHKAKADFLRLIEASIIKLHGITTLTADKKVELKDAIVMKREEFGDDVATWATDLMMAMNELLDVPEDLDATPPVVAGLIQQNDAKILAFEEDMETDNIVNDSDPVDSVIFALETYNLERLVEVDD
jgi:hypothetical protein